MIFQKQFLIGQEMVTRGLITQDQLDEALIYQTGKGIRLGRSLIALGYLQETELIDVLADQLGIEKVDLEAATIPPEAFSLMTGNDMKKFMCIPLALSNESVTVCVADPTNTQMMKKVQQHIGQPLVITIAPERSITACIDRHMKTQ